ncbi:MAG: hypothetical protein A2145_04340 [candidate division Zixibacteria bacterium RBG_16_40_9]|nr:MAG: hypothetical protein A2145_04340 [candidate division Zixibacteria bacterium RBG_16_40_9]
MNSKRIITTTFLGVLFGVASWFLTKNSPVSAASGFTSAVTLAVILDRVILGFVLGISGWRVNYLVHGIFLGALVSLPLAFFMPNFWVFWLTGMGCGFLIELISKFLVKDTRPAMA